MPNNGDTDRVFRVDNSTVRGLGSFHKTLPHNQFGEVVPADFLELVNATRGDGSGFADVPRGTSPGAAQLTNPQAGLAQDRLTRPPTEFTMPPAPGVLSQTTAAEMTELYWMALLRDVPFTAFAGNDDVVAAAAEISARFQQAAATNDPARVVSGVDLPGAFGASPAITPQNVFRIGLPGEEVGPLVSQFFLRPIHFGTQTIDQQQRPYKSGLNFLTRFNVWLAAQNSGRDADGQDYSKANENGPGNFEDTPRYIGSMRDLARFVNKDALHQAYFNAALVLLSGGAKWTPGNPYTAPNLREAGFGVLGGPHILALVSEVATRALKIVWNQKWQVHLRLRPEAYGGHLHVQQIGVVCNAAPGVDPVIQKRAYGLPDWAGATAAAGKIKALNKDANGGGDAEETLLLPMAFTPGSPSHPAYGAGHATVAGACVTVLKAYFKMIADEEDLKDGVGIVVGAPLPFRVLKERDGPHKGDGDPASRYYDGPIRTYITGTSGECGSSDVRTPLDESLGAELTIEGELNKLAANVAMGRSMGGVHWRSDNTRSLILGEALAAQILAEITTDANERPEFTFRTFARDRNGDPGNVVIRQGHIYVNGTQVEISSSDLLRSAGALS